MKWIYYIIRPFIGYWYHRVRRQEGRIVGKPWFWWKFYAEHWWYSLCTCLLSFLFFSWGHSLETRFPPKDVMRTGKGTKGMRLSRERFPMTFLTTTFIESHGRQSVHFFSSATSSFVEYPQLSHLTSISIHSATMTSFLGNNKGLVDFDQKSLTSMSIRITPSNSFIKS